MTKRLFLFCTTFLLTAATLWSDNIPIRQERREHFSVLPVNENNIVFLGNSITHYGTWPEFFGADGTVLNRGIGWNVTQEVMGHFDYVIKGHPKAVFIMIGVNDVSALGTNAQKKVVAGIERMVQIALEESPKTKIYVQSILPSSDTRDAVVTKINPDLQTICNNYENATYVDIFTPMKAAGVDKTMDDGLHPHYKGYRIWIKEIEKLDMGLKVKMDTTKTFTNVLTSTPGNRTLGQYAMLPIADGDVVMMGDYFINEGFWSEFFCQNAKVKNRGIGTQVNGTNNLSSAELSKVATPILHDIAKPSKIFIEVGTKDVYDGMEAATIVNNIKTGITKIKSLSPNAEIYLQGMFPVREQVKNVSIIKPANKLMQEYAEKTEGVTYIDLYPHFVNDQDELALPYQSSFSGGFGVSALLYSKWAHILLPYLGEGFEALPELPEDVHFVKTSTDSTRIYYNITANNRTLGSTNKFVTCKGEEEGLMGEDDSNNANQHWMFRQREDGNWDIISRLNGSFIDPNSAANNEQLKTSKEQPSEGWTITPIANNNVIITCSTIQLHQANSSLSWKILNWGNGTNTTDAGCQLYVEPIYYTLEKIKDIETLPADNSVKLYTDHETLGHLLPQPKSVRLTNTQFPLKRDIQVKGDADFCAEPALTRFLETATLTKVTESTTSITINKVDEIKGTFNHAVADFENEAYQLVIEGNSIIIDAVTRTGVIRALQTLSQLVEDDTNALPGAEIVDWPAFKVRGYMHDIGRSFISVAELKKEIDLLARFKVNVFHWHLTDHYGFRFESKAYPKVNTNFNSARWPKNYYTQQECKEIEKYARERGMIIIPEIDMPGHSTSFTAAMGYTMSSESGKTALKAILSELVETFEYAPYIHIGGDETAEATASYINEMADYVRNLGKKVVIWNRYGSGTSVSTSVVHCDMTTNWATSGVISQGIPNIDMRYNYTNHFDVFADLAGIYRSNIFNVQRGTSDVAGSISGMWNDRLVNDEKLILAENNFYTNVLATAERAWKGGGKQYIETGGAYLPNTGEEYDEFKDFETRFLFHKAECLKDEPIPYVKQTNVKWCITTNNATGLEQQDTLKITPGCTIATGAGIWLNHIWAGTIAGVLGKSAQGQGQTRYAWTYVYSPKQQTVGAQIEFYNYSRSDKGSAPAKGKWDNMGSQVWLNGEELTPTWNWTTAGNGENDDLGNVNFPARKPLSVNLKKGWNKVLMKLPYKNVGNQRGNKWQYTFVFTDTEGKAAVEDLIYSPSMNPDPNFVDTVPPMPDPWNGKTLYFTNVQQNGKEYTLYITSKKLLSSTSTIDKLGAKAYFVCNKVGEGKYSLYNENSKLYMIWRGKSGGYNSDGGTLGTYTSPWCDWTFNDASGTKAGTYYLVSKRSNGSTDGSLILTSAGAWDAYANAVGWATGYSNLFYIKEVPTGVTDFTVTERSTPVSIYNLAGQRLTTTPRSGIYILNGKKVIQ